MTREVGGGQGQTGAKNGAKEREKVLGSNFLFVRPGGGGWGMGGAGGGSWSPAASTIPFVDQDGSFARNSGSSARKGVDEENRRGGLEALEAEPSHVVAISPKTLPMVCSHTKSLHDANLYASDRLNMRTDVRVLLYAYSYVKNRILQKGRLSCHVESGYQVTRVKMCMPVCTPVRIHVRACASMAPAAPLGKPRCYLPAGLDSCRQECIPVDRNGQETIPVDRNGFLSTGMDRKGFLSTGMYS